MEQKQLQAPSFLEFIQEFEQHVLDGWRVKSYTTVADAPQNAGNYSFYTTLQREEKVVQVPSALQKVEETVEPAPKTTVGRKPKQA